MAIDIKKYISYIQTRIRALSKTIEIKKCLSYIPLFIMVLLIADLFLRFLYVRKEYGFDLLLDRETGGFTENSLSNLSENNNSEISLIIFRPPINSKKNEIGFIVFSTIPFSTFKLNKLELVYDNKVTDFTRKLELDWEPSPVQYKFNENTIDGYELRFYGNYEKNYKASFYKIFKKGNFNFGDEFNVQLIVNYSLDSKKYSKKLDYVVECLEAPQYPPNWYMALFPGAY